MTDTAGPALAALADEKIKLRLHYAGSWEKDGDKWRYKNGEVYNESIDRSFKYADVCKRLNDKFGDTVSFQYLVPGDELSPDNLAQVTGDDDLEEMFAEYMEAVNAPGGRSLRIKVFASSAQQIELFADEGDEKARAAAEDDGEPELDEMEEDMLDDDDEDDEYGDAIGTDFDAHDYLHSSLMLYCDEVDPSVEASCEPEYGAVNWSDFEAEESSIPSAQPSEDREQHHAAATVRLPAAFEKVAMHNITKGVNRMDSAFYGMPAGMPVAGCWAGAEGAAKPFPGVVGQQPMVYVDAGAGRGAMPPVAAPAEKARLLQQDCRLAALESGDVSMAGYCYYDTELDDPYAAEQATGLAASGPALHPSHQPAQLFPTAPGGMPLQPVAHAAGPYHDEQQLRQHPAAAADQFPSHISAFGDSASWSLMHEGGPAAPVDGGRPQLPSRISVFGDGSSADSAGLHQVEGAIGGAGLGTPGAPPGLHRLANSSRAPNWVAAEPLSAMGYRAAADDVGGCKCITQDFGAVQPPSLLEGCPGGGAAGFPLDPLQPLADCNPDAEGMALELEIGPSASALMGVVKKPRSEVVTLSKIGEGAFGEVSQAQVFPYGVVAVKWLKRDRFAKYSESFQREAEMLARLNHPNIIRMYGLVMDTDSSSGAVGGAAPGGSNGGAASGVIAGIITEFVRNGSLSQYLRAQGNARLPMRMRAAIALQAALGMAYLHGQQPAVVHFDLKPDNLLVDGEGDSMVIKVADFGLSKHKFSSHVSCRDLRGTLPYMAPELVSNPTQVSEKCDVWSMGVVMWELLTLESPFADLTAQSILMGLMHGNLHLSIPASCEPEWRSLIETCMDANPANRPTFQQLAMQLQEILRLERQSSKAAVLVALAAAAAAVSEDLSDSNSRMQPPVQAPLPAQLPPLPARMAAGTAGFGLGLGVMAADAMAHGQGLPGAGAWAGHNYGIGWGIGGAALEYGAGPYY